jgi:hypothetical protein
MSYINTNYLEFFLYIYKLFVYFYFVLYIKKFFDLFFANFLKIASK